MADAITVVVAGALGKVGATMVAAVEAAPGLTLAAAVDLGDDLQTALTGAKALVDFTAPGAAPSNARLAIAAGVAPVIGTTGLAQEDVDEIERLCAAAGVGGAVIPNFAIGAVLMMRLAEIAAPYFEAAEVIEAHHATKLDAPSGTALATARRLAAARGAAPFARTAPSKVTLDGTRGGEEGRVGVHSLRLPGLVADQEVVFGATGQTLSIAHRTTSREAFVPGVLATIRAAVDNRRFYRSLDEVLGL